MLIFIPIGTYDSSCNVPVLFHNACEFNRVVTKTPIGTICQYLCTSFPYQGICYYKNTIGNIKPYAGTFVSSFVCILPEASIGLRVFPLPVSVCVCVCVSLCVNHLFVRTVTQEPFKLGSPNLDHRFKRPWLISVRFWRMIDHELQGQI